MEFARRQRRVRLLRKHPWQWVGAREFYKDHPVEFIQHWCMTYDPRNAVGDLPALMPFVLFRRQREFVEFLHSLLRAHANGLVEKSRDMGATWVCCAISVWLFLFWPGSSVGWGSRKAMLVDDKDNPDSIFEKFRVILRNLPRELRPEGFSLREHMTSMKIVNPETGATITGEGGDNIGRGGRSLIYFKDESAHYEHPESIEAALSDNALVQVDISSVNGTGNVFHRRRESGTDWAPGQPMVVGKTYVFVADWTDHPGKTQAWYDARRKKAEDEGLLHVFAQEVDRDYAAAVEGVVIPALWVRAAIDAHVKLGVVEDGQWWAGLDVADDGGDTNALARRRGPILKSVEEWGERDTGVTARRAVAGCDGLGPVELQYDCIGVGAGIKAETNRLSDDGLLPRQIRLVPWNAGEGPLHPEKRVVQRPDGSEDKDSPLNKDFYKNLKAQGWWKLRRRFEITYRALTEDNFTWSPEDIVSLPSDLPLLRKLEKELSQPVAEQSTNMKLLINKAPSGQKSPNLADAVMMAYWPIPVRRPLVVTDAMLVRAAQPQ